ncbi:gamete antigen 27/25 [Plasmodium brasilianum]|uniref:Gamete antigen 27/25 n=1 Tax=Plasmodium brasilianum TaxID=5824 RepID=A0ACB9YDP5_PLABR|nr:gamete antigen 27/25 [Plasmodium brasilianum]
MFKKYIFLLSLNILLKSIFNISLFDDQVLCFLRKIDNSFENINGTLLPSINGQVVEVHGDINEYNETPNNYLYNNGHAYITSDYYNDSSVDQGSIYNSAYNEEVDGLGYNIYNYEEYEGQDENVNLDHSVQDELDNMSENEDLYNISELYDIIILILNLEFETTNTYVNKLVHCSSIEEKKRIINNHFTIILEIFKNAKKMDNLKVPFELLDSMALRIKNRITDFCLDEDLNENYLLILKNIFEIEQNVFKGLFCYISCKNTLKEKKDVINDLQLISYYHEELAEDAGIEIPVQLLVNAAMRTSNFVSEMFYLFIPSHQEDSSSDYPDDEHLLSD